MILNSRLTTRQLQSLWRSSLLSGANFQTRCFPYGKHATYTTGSDTPQLSRTRNIGIIAHIDAGKTTTTERMLYYSGFTRRIGDVDDGSTVTDFLPAERARGITIQSAAITFKWPPQPTEAETAEVVKRVDSGDLPMSALSHHINLIDTPGHADFTFEVMRSLRILDGAVCILDGVAGVEAQTEQVWKQAGEWSVPRLVYVNKLDRDGAAFGKTVIEVASRLGGWPAICEIPWWEGGNGRFTGTADVVNLRGLLYPKGGDGKLIKVLGLQELDEQHPKLAAELRRARVALVELLSEHDETMVDAFLENNEDHLAVPAMTILLSLRKCLLNQSSGIIPLFAGASFRNIGIQPLLDSVVNLLPGPEERPDSEITLGATKSKLRDFLDGKALLPQVKPTALRGQKLRSAAPSLPPGQILEGCALAFKVVNDPRKGILVYIRVYSGSIRRGALLYNTNLNVAEKASMPLRMYASESVSVQSIEAGQIGVLAGMKHARTGDTLIACHGNKPLPPEPFNLLQLRPIKVPPPVFFASIEPHSLREEKDMHEKLALLLREDPSLNVTQDEDTGQTLLAGMGELHLEIARDRLVTDMKAKATMGAIEIGYRETILQSSQKITKIFDRETAGQKGKAGCSVTVQPLSTKAFQPAAIASENAHLELEAWSQERDDNVITVLTPSFDDHNKAAHVPGEAFMGLGFTLLEARAALMNGALAALGRGPGRSHQVRNVHITISLDPFEHVFGTATTISALSAAGRLATTTALRDAAQKGGTCIMEPVMDVILKVDESSLGAVVHDISSSRGGHVVSLDAAEDDANISSQSSNQHHHYKRPIDLSKIYAPPDPFDPHGHGMRRTNNNTTSSTSTSSSSSSAAASHPPLNTTPQARIIRAKVPLKEMVGYLKHLRSISGGRGTFVMSVDRFEKMSAQREKALLAGY